jgi:hypothetical protein
MKITVYNKNTQKISRGERGYPPQTTSTYEIRDKDFPLIKATRDLKIIKIEYSCPICKKVFKSKESLHMHFIRVHKEKKK